MEQTSAEQLLRRTVTRAEPGDIIVAHLTRPQTAQVLPDLIRRLREREFDLVPVSELLSE
ncbi:MAG: hypothetical protein KatS3mg060_3603 [Dehalococcoidia bacterium]|nr:MAG: hypothetical protein KatS3mg060_3603 [Dehalococcoidia bacterium]